MSRRGEDMLISGCLLVGALCCLTLVLAPLGLLGYWVIEMVRAWWM